MLKSSEPSWNLFSNRIFIRNRCLQVQHHPGTVALQTRSRKNPGKTLFPFPVITDSALRQVSDNGMAKEIPVDILPTDVRLEPKQTTTMNIWLRAPETLGTHSIPVYFYYEAPAPSETSRIHHYRMLKLNFVIKTSALVSVNAVRNHPCLHDNNLCQTVVVAVNNTSTAVHTQHQVRPFSAVMVINLNTFTYKYIWVLALNFFFVLYV